MIKKKNIITKKAILLFSLIFMIVLSGGIVGGMHLFAEPTIDQLVKADDIGTFKPNIKYTDQDANLTAWMNTTFLQFSYDVWKDTDGDGKINPQEDIYYQDGFESKMLMSSVNLPVYKTKGDENYYFINLSGFANYNGILAQLDIANNNDNAEMKNTALYWLDRENNILYISKDMLEDDIEDNDFDTVRMQINMVFKDIKTAEKKVNVVTYLDESITDAHGLEQIKLTTPSINIYNWTTGPLTVSFVESKYFPYISTENIEVYKDGCQFNEWIYDNVQGILSINCEHQSTDTIIVKIKKLNDISKEECKLQNKQYKNNEVVGQGSGIKFGPYDAYPTGNGKNVKWGVNVWTQPIVYTTDPNNLIGESEDLSTNNSSNFRITTFFSGAGKKLDHAADGSDGAVVNAVPTGLTNNMNNIFFTEGKFISSYTWSATHGKLSSDQQQNLGKIIDAINAGRYDLLQGFINTSLNDDKTFNASLKIEHGSHYRYFVGRNCTEFLGGAVQANYGQFYVAFDVGCASIQTPQILYSNTANGTPNNYDTKVTIIGYDSTNNQMLVCISSTNLPAPGVVAAQRILAFSNMAVSYNPKGTLQLTKKNTNGTSYVGRATYKIYKKENTGDQFVTTITTKDTSAVTWDLIAGDYYLEESEAAPGYLLDKTQHDFTVTAGQAVSVDVTDSDQYGRIDFTVYDETTENNKKVPVEGVKFCLYNKSNGTLAKTYDKNGTPIKNEFTTDKNGKAYFLIRTLDNSNGGYYLKEIETVQNYHTNHNRTVNFDMAPDQTGGYLGKELIIYEPRQTVKISSQVEDSNLKENTPVDLGGESTTGADVSVENATYGLYLKDGTEILLGYTKKYASPIIVKSESNQMNLYVGTEEVNSNIGALTTINSAAGKGENIIIGTQSSDKVYLFLEKFDNTILNNLADCPDTALKIPNGQYYWKLQQASKGYHSDNSTTSINAAWSNKKTEYSSDDSVFPTLVRLDPVIETRQTVSIDAYVKSYSEKSDTSTAPDLTNYPTKFRNKNKTRIKSYNEVNAERLAYQISHPSGVLPDRKWTDFIDSDITKSIYSTESSIFPGVNKSNPEEKPTSKELGIQYVNNNQKIVVLADVAMPGANYSLVNLGDIVDINTGEIIPAITNNFPTKLGSFTSDSSGHISIDKITNSVITVDGSQVQGHSLPNGRYALVLETEETGSENDGQLGLDNDIIDFPWSKDSSTSSNIKKQSLTMLYKKDTTKPDIYKLILAPDVPVDKTHLYNPLDGENNNQNNIYLLEGTEKWKFETLTGNKLPTLITMLTKTPWQSSSVKKWIDKNSNCYSYRMLDLSPGNITTTDTTTTYDVSDELPTTFGFYLDHDVRSDPLTTSYKYNTSYYYQITENEFNNAPNDKKSNGEDGNKEGQTYEDIMKKAEYYNKNIDGTTFYMRRFANQGLSGSPNLTDIITLNNNVETSPGYLSYSAITDKAPVWGSVYGTQWLNEKMKEMYNEGTNSDKTFRIFVRVDVEKTTTSKIDGSKTVKIERPVVGSLKIKNRELFDLD